MPALHASAVPFPDEEEVQRLVGDAADQMLHALEELGPQHDEVVSAVGELAELLGPELADRSLALRGQVLDLAAEMLAGDTLAIQARDEEDALVTVAAAAARMTEWVISLLAVVGMGGTDLAFPPDDLVEVEQAMVHLELDFGGEA